MAQRPAQQHRRSFDWDGGLSGDNRAEGGRSRLFGLDDETKEILKSSAPRLLLLFFLAAMNTLRPVGLVRLIKRSLMPALLTGLLAGSVAPCLAAEPVELALRKPAHASRIVLDLSKRQITLMRGEQQLGAWPVAIGDPKTPTPKGEFAILNKKVNQTYVTHKSGQRRELRGPGSPIGDRCMAFHRNGRGEFGIHGTAWPHWVQIRAAVSLGCVRMLNSHIRQLFDAVDVGTRLEIRS